MESEQVKHTAAPWKIENPVIEIAQVYFVEEFKNQALADAELIARAPDLLKENERLKEALKKILDHIDAGRLVRDISKDHEPDWAVKLAPLLMDLKEAAKLVRP
jgi:hypothetical protein